MPWNWEYNELDGCVFSVEAVHVATLMASHGYFFPIDDHYLIVKNDNTYYRFQVRPSQAVNDFKTLTWSRILFSEDIFNGLTFNLEFISQLRQDFRYFDKFEAQEKTF